MYSCSYNLQQYTDMSKQISSTYLKSEKNCITKDEGQQKREYGI